jgi:phthalate 4,5-dioxygenase reductase subunit
MTDPAFPAATEMVLRVAAKVPIAQDIVLFELVPQPGGVLPAFSAGAHIIVRTPAGLRRQYSLCNDPAEVDRYWIAVKREALGQGGSRSMVDDVQPGQLLQVSPPANHFALQASQHILLVAGGIGITPILAMAHDLAAAGRPFQLIYCTRSPKVAPFLDLLRTDAMLAPCTTVHHDDGDRTLSFDFAALLQMQPAGTHVYCCGPARMMHTIRALTRDWSADTVHFEEFAPMREQEIRDGDAAIIVKLARQGKEVEVPVGMSILQVLRDQGQRVSSSCEAGTCGSCRTTVLSGVPDHRCFVMDEDDNSEIMLCVSRAKTQELLLDL